MHDISYLRDILVLLFASVFVVIIFQEIGLSPALGYVVAGTMIGPFGFGIVSGVETTKSIAELGIVFMLFAIGLELTFARLMTIKKYVLGFGGLQIALTSTVIYFICKYYFKMSSEASIIVGSALAMSSTAIVMQVIAENAEQSTRVGRLSFSILLMQDLVVIPILVLLPILKNTQLNITHALGGAIADAVIAMAIIFFIGRIAIRPLYRLIAKSNSDVLFLSLTLIVVLGSAYITNHLGMSFALGAFIAGLLVAETEYRYRVEEEILSLKSILLGLFFMTIGMSFDFDMLMKSFPYIVLISLSLIILKASIIIGLCRLFKFPLAPAIHAGLLLSQGGEFAFVVFLIAVQQDFLSPNISQFLMTTVTFTMALTPILANIGRKTKAYFYTKEILRDNKIKREIGQISKHVVIIGFSKVGRIVSYILRKKNINYLILENNHRVATFQRNKGFNIYYGDALNIDILRHIGVDKAESVVIAIEDEFACMKITRFIHENFPNVAVITKSENINNADRLKKVGASFVVAKNVETGLQLSHAALSSVGVSSEEINSALNAFRDINTEVMKDFVDIVNH
jgi:CPA2 family monovalent cation:H+ antiporter-2